MKPQLNVEHIKKIWILDLIVKNESFKKAAVEAKVSPSAVSQSLAALEKAIGKPLVIRERGTVVATREALELLERVRPAFDVFARLEGGAELVAPPLTSLSFGTYESIAIDLLPKLISDLRSRIPGLRLSLRISRTAELLTMVRKGELCSALVTETDGLERFHTEVVGEDRLGVFVAKDLTKGSPSSSSPAAIVERIGLGVLAPGRDGHPRYFAKFMNQLAKADLASKPFASSDSFETLRAAAAAGALAAVLPARVAARLGDLVEITPKECLGQSVSGTHKILLVSPSNCDREEADFLAASLQKLL